MGKVRLDSNHPICIELERRVKAGEIKLLGPTIDPGPAKIHASDPMFQAVTRDQLANRLHAMRNYLKQKLLKEAAVKGGDKVGMPSSSDDKDEKKVVSGILKRRKCAPSLEGLVSDTEEQGADEEAKKRPKLTKEEEDVHQPFLKWVPKVFKYRWQRTDGHVHHLVFVNTGVAGDSLCQTTWELDENQQVITLTQMWPPVFRDAEHIFKFLKRLPITREIIGDAEDHPLVSGMAKTVWNIKQLMGTTKSLKSTYKLDIGEPVQPWVNGRDVVQYDLERAGGSVIIFCLTAVNSQRVSKVESQKKVPVIDVFDDGDE